MSKPTLLMLAQMDRDALRSISEHDFSVAVVAFAKEHGWLVHYERHSGHVGANGRWRGSGPKGKPDLTLGRDGTVLLVELKTEQGKPSQEQIAWLKALGDYGRLWRPRDATAALETLSG